MISKSKQNDCVYDRSLFLVHMFASLYWVNLGHAAIFAWVTEVAHTTHILVSYSYVLDVLSNALHTLILKLCWS
jgi:hypothetical protein